MSTETGAQPVVALMDLIDGEADTSDVITRKLLNREPITLEDLATEDPRFIKPDYTNELLDMSLLVQVMESKLTQMRKKSTGLIPETRERVKIGNAIRSIRRAAKELQK